MYVCEVLARALKSHHCFCQYIWGSCPPSPQHQKPGYATEACTTCLTKASCTKVYILSWCPFPSLFFLTLNYTYRHGVLVGGEMPKLSSEALSVLRKVPLDEDLLGEVERPANDGQIFQLVLHHHLPSLRWTERQMNERGKDNLIIITGSYIALF